MEPQHDDEHEGPDSPPEGARASDNGGPAPGPQVIATDDPSINSEFAYLSDPKGEPDQAMVIEASTSRIRESHGSIIPRVYTGVVEHVRPPHERSNSGKGPREEKKGGEDKRRKDSSGQDEHGKKDERGKKDRGGGQRGRPSQGPSLTRILLFSGIVSLVFGMIGGWSYSYFFGSSSKGDQQGSGQGSGSGKKSDSSDKDSDTGSDSDSDSGSGKGSRKPGRGSEPETGGGTGARADRGMKRSLGVTAVVIPMTESAESTTSARKKIT